jgi:hypothetical protein
MYTWAGDSDLNGTVNGADYFAIDSGFSAQQSQPLGVLYSNGDFDYSGVIDADDYWLIDRSYGAQSGTFATSPPLGGVNAVPEPSASMLLLVAGAALLKRRRR